MKNTAHWQVKRKVKVPSLQKYQQFDAISELLITVSGVKNVLESVQKKYIIISYDATKVNYCFLLEKLGSAGFQVSISYWQSIKRICYQFIDDNIKNNAKAPAPACCNKVPRVK